MAQKIGTTQAQAGKQQQQPPPVNPPLKKTSRPFRIPGICWIAAAVTLAAVIALSVSLAKVYENNHAYNGNQVVSSNQSSLRSGESSLAPSSDDQRTPLRSQGTAGPCDQKPLENNPGLRGSAVSEDQRQKPRANPRSSDSTDSTKSHATTNKTATSAYEIVDNNSSSKDRTAMSNNNTGALVTKPEKYPKPPINNSTNSFADKEKPPVQKTAWPELVGVPAKQAQGTILEETGMDEGSLNIVVVPRGSVVTMDYRTNRVRLFVNEDGTVAITPRIG